MNIKTTVCAALAVIVPALTPLAQNRGQAPENQNQRPPNGPPPGGNFQSGPESQRGSTIPRFGRSQQDSPRPHGVPQTGESIFSLLDANHDGELDNQEIRAASSVLRRLDINRDGIVERREIGFAPLLSDRRKKQELGGRSNQSDRERKSPGDNPGPPYQQERQMPGRSPEPRDNNQNLRGNDRQNRGDNSGRNQGPLNEPQWDADRQGFRNTGPNQNRSDSGEARDRGQGGRDDRPDDRSAQRGQKNPPRKDADFQVPSNRQELPNPDRQDRQQNSNPRQNLNQDPNREQGQDQNRGQRRDEKRGQGDNGGRNEAPLAEPQKDGDSQPK